MPKEFLTFDIRIDDWNKSVTMISIDISLDRKETATISFFFSIADRVIDWQITYTAAIKPWNV